jgi:hypothetical protein
VEKAVFQTPGLYADHHVTAARERLLAQPGVQAVYVSSAFFVVEVSFDETLTTPELLARQLEELGYLNEIPAQTETWVTPLRGGPAVSFRRSATHKMLNKSISFQQRVPYSRRPVWNCPGVGVIQALTSAAFGD